MSQKLRAVLPFKTAVKRVGRKVFANNQVCENSGYRDFLQSCHFFCINDSAEGAIMSLGSRTFIEGQLLNKTPTRRKRGYTYIAGQKDSRK